jgi:hypothetical protein
MRLRPSRASPSAVSGAMRSAATGRGASAWRVLPGRAMRCRGVSGAGGVGGAAPPLVQ